MRVRDPFNSNCRKGGKGLTEKAVFFLPQRNFLKLILALYVTLKMELDVIRAPHEKDSKIISKRTASEKNKKTI